MIIRVNVVLSLTLRMTNAHVRFSKRQSLAINNSPIQDYAHADDLAPPNYKLFSLLNVLYMFIAQYT